MSESRGKSKSEGVNFSPFALSARQLSQQIERMRRDRVLRGKVVNLEEYRQMRERREPATVLVVDDERSLCQALARILEKEGLRVVAVAGDDELRRAIETNPVDIILLDIQLPWLDGLEFCSALKAEPALRDIPVILLSGHVSKDDIRKGFEAGCDEYLTKPLDMNRLVRTLKYMIQP